MKGAIITDTTIKYPSHNDLVQWYYQLAQSIAESAGVTPEQVNDLIDAYITEHPYPVVPDDIITQTNAAANVVTSVNGEKGDVTVTGGGDVPENVITTDNIAQNAVTSFNGVKGDVTGVASVNGRTGVVTVSESPANVITIDNLAANAVTSFNGAKGDVTGVTSVNGKTGVVTVAESPQNVITDDNISTKAVTSFNGEVGAVSAAVPTIKDVAETRDVRFGFIVDFGHHGFMVIQTLSTLATSSDRSAYVVNLPTEYTHAVSFIVTGIPRSSETYFHVKCTTFTAGQNVIRTFVETGSQGNPETAIFSYILGW